MDDALALASVLTAHCLKRQDPPSGGADAADCLPHLLNAVIHQATGMVSAHLAVPLPQALLRLRAHAYSSGRPLTEVAKDIVERRLRLTQQGNDAPPVVDKD